MYTIRQYTIGTSELQETMTKKINFSHPNNFSKIGVTPGYTTPPDASFVSGTKQAFDPNYPKPVTMKGSSKKPSMPDISITIPKP